MSPDVHSSPLTRAERRVGSTLLKWRLDALLGVGGTAAVYAATHHNRSRVALKILHRELSAIPELRTRFLREAYVANSVSHEGAVQVLDDQLSEDGEPVLVMQLLEGQSLDALQTSRGVLGADEALWFADQVLDVLAAAHARGIIHRDIKPQNLFVTRAGAVKVLDFGVARLFDGTASMTATGVLVGTPAFMPPEQAGGRIAEIGPPSDLWAVGATVFTLLTGRFVHEAENAQQHTIRAAVFPARSLATVRPDLPKPLVEWVDKALAFDMNRRFQTANEMRGALTRARTKMAAASAKAGVGGGPGAAAAPGAGMAGAAGGPAGSAASAAPGIQGVVGGSGAPGGQGAPGGTGPAGMGAASGFPNTPDHGTGAHGPPGGGAAAQQAPDPALLARQHGLPPPAPKRQLTRAEMGGIAGVFFVFVFLAAFVVHRLASGGGGGSGDATPAASGTARSTAAAALSAWVGSPSSSGAGGPGADPPAEPTPHSKRFSEEAKAAIEGAEQDVRLCGKRLGPKGRMSVDVTFHPDGETTAQVEIRFGRTPTGVCVEEAFRSKRLTAFEGPAVTVTRMVTVPEK